jgi:hypothetical protein
MRAAHAENVDALASVHTLDLSDYHGIRDVSALRGVHTLDLSWCDGITDVSALSGVHSLTLPNGRRGLRYTISTTPSLTLTSSSTCTNIHDFLF